MDSPSTVKSTDVNNLDTTFFPDKPGKKPKSGNWVQHYKTIKWGKWH